jgi:hypothetical protein
MSSMVSTTAPIRSLRRPSSRTLVAATSTTVRIPTIELEAACTDVQVIGASEGEWTAGTEDRLNVARPGSPSPSSCERLLSVVRGC